MKGFVWLIIMNYVAQSEHQVEHNLMIFTMGYYHPNFIKKSLHP